MPMRPIRQVIGNRPLIKIGPDATVLEAARLMDAGDTASVVIMEDDRLVGIFTERDLLRRVVISGLQPGQTRVSEVMTPSPATVDIEQRVVHAMHIMNENGFRHVPVVEDGRVVGVISMRDAMGREVAAFEHDCSTKEHISEILA